VNDKQLDYFVRIAELGSFRKASEGLRIAQPALTRQIKKLEAELGVELFRRGSRGITLTPPGLLLLDRARFIRRQTEQALADVIAKGTIPSGVAGFGAPPSIAQLLFVPLSQSYLSRYPEVKLSFFEGVGHLRDWLLNGEIDLAILPNGRWMANKSVHLENLVREPVYLVGPSGAFAPGATCRYRDLIALPLILAAPPSTVRGWLDAEVLRTGETLRIVVETESLQIQKRLVEEKLGYALLPHSAVYRDYEAGTLTLSRVEGWLMDRVLAWRSDRPLTPAIQTLIAATRAEVQRLVAAGAFGPAGEPG